MYGQRRRLFDGPVEIEGRLFLATLSRGAGGTDILTRVEDVGEVGVVDLVDDENHVFAVACDTTVFVIVQPHNDTFIL